MEKQTLSSLSPEFTKDVLKEIYSNLDDSDVSLGNVEEYNITSVNEPGQGEFCDIFKLEIIRRKQNFYFIVKVLSKNKDTRDVIYSAGFLKKEVHFYNSILPKFLLMQKLSGAKYDFQNDVQRCFKAFVNGSDDFIVFNDLNKLGYSSPINAIEGLSREETYKATEVLAKFHSLSMAFKKMYFNEFCECAKSTPEILYCSSNKRWLSEYINRALEIIENIILLEVGPQNEMFARFKNFTCGDFYGRLVNLLKVPSKYMVMCNGNAQALNFMFSEKGAALLDFQLTHFSSPVTDLFYLLFSSVKPGVLVNHYESILKFYYKAMGNYLADMGVSISEVFCKSDYSLEIEKYASLGLAMTFNTMLLSVQDYDQRELNFNFDSSSNVSLEDIIDINFPNNINCRQRVICALRLAINNGFM